MPDLRLGFSTIITAFFAAFLPFLLLLAGTFGGASKSQHTLDTLFPPLHALGEDGFQGVSPGVRRKKRQGEEGTANQ